MVELTTDEVKSSSLGIEGLELNCGWMNAARPYDRMFLRAQPAVPPTDTMSTRGTSLPYILRLLSAAGKFVVAEEPDRLIGADEHQIYGRAGDIVGKRFIWETGHRTPTIEIVPPTDAAQHCVANVPYDIYSFESAREATWNLLVFCNSLGGITAVVDKILNNILIAAPYPALPGEPGINVLISQQLQEEFDLIIGLLPVKTKEKPKARKFPTGFYMGADIEFSFLDSDRTFHAAYEFVPDNTHGEIGTDGNVETLEIRPEKAKTPEELTEHTKEILSALDNTLPEGIDLWCGGGADIRRSTGLHIHFSGMRTDVTTRGNQETDPRTFAVWLDALLAKPILKACGGIQRGDRHYGQLTDVRHQLNHQGFPHRGFEYRTLPTVCINERMTRAIFAIAYMAAIQFETIGGYKFDEKKPIIEWYRGLPKFDNYEKDIKIFCDYLEKNGTFAVPCLASWFNKTFHKSEEGDIVIKLCDELAYLGEGFKMYNPQRFAHNFFVCLRKDDGNTILITKKIKAPVLSWLIQQYGVRLVHKQDFREEALSALFKNDKDSVAIGLPKGLVKQLQERSQGSRQYVKIFIHQLINQL